MLSFSSDTIRAPYLGAVDLVVLAPLKATLYRTALTGGASYLDVFFIAPGIHYQQDAAELNGAEYPTTGAMTSGYVMRVENQATVSYLQGIGKTACLTTVAVSSPGSQRDNFGPIPAGTLPSTLYHIGPALTVAVMSTLVTLKDWWALAALLTLMFARLLNVIVIKRRSQMGWKGQPEPGVVGDLLILLSQDRWIRMRGMVDDLKAVTSGSWLGNMSNAENIAVNLATILVYLSPVLSSNATTVGNLLLGGLLITSAGLLGACNMATTNLQMFGRVLRVVGEPKVYQRRLYLAEELIEETGRDDWAIAMGMIVPKAEKLQKVTP